MVRRGFDREGVPNITFEYPSANTSRIREAMLFILDAPGVLLLPDGGRKGALARRAEGHSIRAADGSITWHAIAKLLSVRAYVCCQGA
jgi:hypothetical protein